VRKKLAGAFDREIANPTGIGIDLYWLPLGAGGCFVRFNGRVYELLHAFLQRRPRCDLYHSALVVTVPQGRFVIENAWPIPDGDSASRGVTVEGPVWSRRLGRFKAFRYEVRRWLDGTIADVDEAIESPLRVSNDETVARQLLALADSVPAHVWGRDELGVGEMWNSNSVISWLLTKAGVAAMEIPPPKGGRAPGWASGVAATAYSSSQSPRSRRDQTWARFMTQQPAFVFSEHVPLGPDAVPDGENVP
jgi:hypothetical protein